MLITAYVFDDNDITCHVFEASSRPTSGEFCRILRHLSTMNSSSALEVNSAVQRSLSRAIRQRYM
jgi:hypothetical protein